MVGLESSACRGRWFTRIPRRTTSRSSRPVHGVVNWGRTGTTGTWSPARVFMQYCAARCLCFIHSGRPMVPRPVPQTGWLRWVTLKPYNGAQDGSRPWRTRTEEQPIGSQLGNSPAPGVATRKEATACFPPRRARSAPVLRDQACHREGGRERRNQVESAQRGRRQGRPAQGGVAAHEGCARGKDDHDHRRRGGADEEGVDAVNNSVLKSLIQRGSSPPPSSPLPVRLWRNRRDRGQETKNRSGKSVLERLALPNAVPHRNGQSSSRLGQGCRPPRQTTPLNSFASPACARVRLASDTVECSSSPRSSLKSKRRTETRAASADKNMRTYLGTSSPTSRASTHAARSANIQRQGE